MISNKFHVFLYIRSNGKAGIGGIFRVKERIGMAIVNPRGIAKGNKNIIVGQ